MTIVDHKVVLLIALVALVASGCLESSATQCASGRLCVDGRLCHEPTDRCVSPEQLAACDGKADGDACSVDAAAGTCDAGLCNALYCGDGIRSATEACEGTDFSGDTCTGLGFYEEGDGLACDEVECSLDTSGCYGRCGDGEINGPEVCELSEADEGDCVSEDFDAGVLSCSALCSGTTDGCVSFEWREREAGYLGGFRDVWGDGESLVGVQRIGMRQFDGASWSEFPTPGEPGDLLDLHAIWGVSTGDLWVGGEGGDLLHRDGSDWTTVPSGTSDIRDLWGFTTDDVFAVSGTGAILHWDGSEWSPMPHPQSATALNAIWGQASNDVWAVGAGGLVLHFDGDTWATVASPSAQDHEGVWGSMTDDVWVVGAERILHFDGDQLTLHPADPPRGLLAVMGRSSSDVFAVGADGLMLHYDGITWVDVSEPSAGVFALQSLWVDSTDTAVVARSGPQGIAPAYHWQGAFVGSFLSANSVGAVWAADSGHVVAVGTAGGYHIDHGVITIETLPIFVQSLWGFAPNHIFGAGYDGLVHYDGNTWSTVTYPGIGLAAVWGTSSDDLWVAGEGGELRHFNGSIWEQEDLGITGNLIALWGSSSDDVYVAGSDGLLFHFDGTDWTLVSLGTVDELYAIWGSGPDDIWVLAAPYTAWHFDGIDWTATALPSDEGDPYSGLSGTAPDDVFAQANGVIAHWNGQRWAPVTVPYGSMRSIFATPTRVLLSTVSIAGLGAGGLHSIVRAGAW